MARREAAGEAAQARARHGRTKAERAAAEAEAELTARIVDGARREREPD